METIEEFFKNRISFHMYRDEHLERGDVKGYFRFFGFISSTGSRPASLCHDLPLPRVPKL